MKLTDLQKRLLQKFNRTGTATITDLKQVSPRWRLSLAALMPQYVEHYGGGFALTQHASKLMTEAMETVPAVKQDPTAKLRDDILAEIAAGATDDEINEWLDSYAAHRRDLVAVIRLLTEKS